MKSFWLGALVLLLFGVGDFSAVVARDFAPDTDLVDFGIYAQRRGGRGQVRVGGVRGGDGFFALTTYTFSEATSASTTDRRGRMGMREKDIHPDLAPFVEVNFDHLSLEIAKGDGERLSTVANLLGCQPALHGEFARWSQARFQLLLPDDGTTPEMFLENLARQVRGDPVLGNQCRYHA